MVHYLNTELTCPQINEYPAFKLTWKISGTCTPNSLAIAFEFDPCIPQTERLQLPAEQVTTPDDISQYTAMLCNGNGKELFSY